MNEEEKKAIDELIMLKHFLETEERYEGQEREVNAIKIVLKLITKLQKENEKYKYLYQKALDNTIKSDRENIELKKENEQLKITVNKQSIDISNNLLELQQKDKKIDLIAFSLADYVMYYEYDKCRNPEMIKQKAKELKQYFETKAKKGE